jgi:rSAM/selenodomain-associated transferase 1
VKTRLAAEVGPVEAAKIYEKLVAAVLRRLPASGRLIMMFDPPDRACEVRTWITQLCPEDHLEFVAQTAGDLGMRLIHAFAHAFAAGCEHVAVVGSDCVEIGAETFAETERALQTHDCAIGPTFDGGYYLLALNQPCSSLFADIPWSTETVFEETMARARAAGLSVYELPRLHDVDTLEDWHRARGSCLG